MNELINIETLTAEIIIYKEQAGRCVIEIGTWRMVAVLGKACRVFRCDSKAPHKVCRRIFKSVASD